MQPHNEYATAQFVGLFAGLYRVSCVYHVSHVYIVCIVSHESIMCLMSILCVRVAIFERNHIIRRSLFTAK